MSFETLPLSPEVDLHTLYVRTQGAVVRRSSRRLVVTAKDSPLKSMRLREIGNLALFGNVELTAPALAALLEEGCSTSLFSFGGQLRGYLSPVGSKNVFLRQSQFRLCDDEAFCLRQARIVVAAKIGNGAAVIERHRRNHPNPLLDETCQALARSAKKAAAAESIPSLMGMEGDAAHVYFQAFGRMVRSEFEFTVRSRRPPKDPVNALLSFGYMLLTGQAVSAVVSLGLDPDAGFLHEMHYGRPSLALDLIEELRHPVVDRLVLRLVNLRQIGPEDFTGWPYDGEEPPAAGIRLTEDARLRFLNAFEEQLETVVQPDEITVRELVRRQAKHLRNAIEGKSDYAAYHARI